MTLIPQYPGKLLSICVLVFLIPVQVFPIEGVPAKELPLGDSPMKRFHERGKKFVTPEIAAERLYKAWRKNDRRAALKVASKEAVNRLFQEKWRQMEPGQNFCPT